MFLIAGSPEGPAPIIQTRLFKVILSLVLKYINFKDRIYFYAFYLIQNQTYNF